MANLQEQKWNEKRLRARQSTIKKTYSWILTEKSRTKNLKMGEQEREKREMQNTNAE